MNWSDHNDDSVESSKLIRRLERVTRVVVVLHVSAWVLMRAVDGWLASVFFRGFPANGAFQMFNPLRRIAEGQIGGVDFQYFHGLGLPYLHFPLFVLFGQSIFASELARTIISFLFFLGSLWFFFSSIMRDQWAKLITLSVAIALMTTYASLYVPANAQLGVRSTVPIILAGVLSRDLSGRSRLVWSGVLIGVAFMLGTEHGVALAVAFLSGHAVLALRKRSLAPVGFSVAALGIAAGIITVAYLLIGGPSGFAGAMEFAFKSVVNDQFWYFGSPPNTFIYSWKQIATDLEILKVIPLAFLALIVVTVLLWRSQAPSSSRVMFALLILVIYGLLTFASYLGMSHSGYFLPLRRVLVVTALAIVFCWWPAFTIDWNRRKKLLSRVCVYLLMILVLGLDLWASVNYAYWRTLPTAVLWHRKGGETQLSERWKADMATSRKVIDSGKDETPEIWSTYAGLVEARYDIFHPTHDYIIHALGKRDRARYVDRFSEIRPKYVQTIRRSLFEYEEWLQSMHWDFYRELIAHYEIVGWTSYSIWWERMDQPRTIDVTDLGPIDLGTAAPTRIELNDELQTRFGVVLLEFDYEISNPWESLPFFGKLPRYLVTLGGAADVHPKSLAPYYSSATLPVFVRSGTDPVVHVNIFSLLPGVSIEISNARARLLELSRDVDMLVSDVPPPGAPLVKNALP